MLVPGGSQLSRRKGKYKMNRTQVLACALLMSSGAALAQGQCLEQVNGGGGFSGGDSNYAPHAGLVTFNYTGVNGATGIVEFANAPAPYVHASVRAPGLTSVLDAKLVYSFDVSGPASSHVPLTFTANFNLKHGTTSNRTSVEFGVAGYAADFSAGQSVSGSVLCHWSGIGRCDGSTSPATSVSSISVNITDSSTFSRGSAYGTITGTLMAPTDSAGRGIGSVHMNAFASDGGGSFGSWAFIDPRFEIDSTCLALNPTAAFELLPGMGNELAMVPVPEPASALLLSGGMLGLCVASPQGSQQARVI